ncbi:Plastocyanin [Candidatus Calditenuaceae archaeon HR02]|nr:Plastocyanin [Candidatus Calditenuaceae archaeon HR02]
MRPVYVAVAFVVAIAVVAVAVMLLWGQLIGATVVAGQTSGKTYTIRSMKGSYLPPEGWKVGDPPVIDDKYYNPARLSISVGDTVVYVNEDEVPHTFTASMVPSGASKFDSGPVNPGDSYRYTFRVSGTYTYYCMLHPHKGGIIEVSP